MIKAPETTLKFLYDLGYQTLEYPGTFGHDARIFSKMVKDNNLIFLVEGESMWYIKNRIDVMLKDVYYYRKRIPGVLLAFGG